MFGVRGVAPAITCRPCPPGCLSNHVSDQRVVAPDQLLHHGRTASAKAASSQKPMTKASRCKFAARRRPLRTLGVRRGGRRWRMAGASGYTPSSRRSSGWGGWFRANSSLYQLLDRCATSKHVRAVKYPGNARRSDTPRSMQTGAGDTESRIALGASDRCAQSLWGLLRLLRGELLDTGRIGLGVLLICGRRKRKKLEPPR
jgi:hypothetical protein